MSYKGKEIGRFTFLVERSKIKELCLAIGDDNPIFFDPSAAKAAGYSDTPAPLTFASLMSFWGFPEIWERMTEAGIDIKRLLHAKEDYEYLAPMYPGDDLLGIVTIDSLRDGAMQMATFKTVFTRGEEEVLIAKMTIMVPPQKGGA
jgi:acyl dehydratase